MRRLVVVSASLFLLATATPALADPADEVTADCSDNGLIDATHSAEAIDTAIARMLNDDEQEPYDCSPELWRLLDLALGDAMTPTRDCIANGRIDGAYSAGALQEARAAMPQILEELSGCPAVLDDAQKEAENQAVSASTTIPRSTAKRYAEHHGRKVAKRTSKVSARELIRLRPSRWYAQVRWPVPRRGVCYAEVIVKRSKSKVVTGTKGRWCTTDSP